MATARSGAMRAGSRHGGDERGSTVWFWLIVLAVLCLIAFLVAWLGGWIRFTTDPRVAEIRVLQEEARVKYAANGGPSNLVEATAAVAAMSGIQQKIDALPQHLRREVERSGNALMRDSFRGRIDAYFKAPPEKRRAELDRQIDQEEFFRKAFETARTLTGGGGQGGRGDGGGGRAGGGGGGNGGGGGAGGGGGGGGGPPRGGTEESRNRWRKSMIDRTTPEERARYVEYRRAMEKRREERGLPSGGPR